MQDFLVLLSSDPVIFGIWTVYRQFSGEHFTLLPSMSEISMKLWCLIETNQTERCFDPNRAK